jgi:hypothetical protein
MLQSSPTKFLRSLTSYHSSMNRGLLGALALWPTLVGAQAVPDSFPRDASGHRYVQSVMLGMDSAAAEQAVALWRGQPGGTPVFACLYGSPVIVDGELRAWIHRVEPISTTTLIAGLDVPVCVGEDAIGFAVFGTGIGNLGIVTEQLSRILTQTPEWVVAMVIYRIVPVPPPVAADAHIPLWVPQLLAVVYAPPKSSPLVRETKS